MRIEGPPQGPQGPQPKLKPKRERRHPPSFYVDEFREQNPFLKFLRYSDEKIKELAKQVRENKFNHVPPERWTDEQRQYAEWMELLGNDDQPFS
ncbi:MAG: hypothetical protein UV76_C0001G0055 [Candidatus Nomurabacteria bacterium GW2011_GWA2_43_15]|uniref:Uncharacterized protein n=2 Tax=Candidatus Nomuraibacteriota TaxID=1752729 RepID=A0A0G1G231_9BACT|nr:MAG: hypothetical protein UV76_C0001G0055 [Candidatus Nomurabacteria bacterium GW2011_GWA2_43_15]KKT19250.1 MAG: hypothetical protein UW02_C0013G0033 [Candidatus Nomurabacteria bacterium GW2011_GWB1_43_7]